jgi:membrane-associated phospholipid phosphatase
MRRALARAGSLDASVYSWIAATETPALDGAMRGLSRAADHGKLWFASAAALSIFGGERGPLAARQGLTALALASASANLLAKPLSRRARPIHPALEVLEGRRVRMPRSSSFPSGHAASAFAFASAAGRAEPRLRAPLMALAGLVGYSRVHTGVHFPGDVLAGALLGVGAGKLVSTAGPARPAAAPPP